MEHLNYFYVAL